MDSPILTGDSGTYLQDWEYSLENGDMIHMKGPDLTTGRPSCQRKYLHTVPVETSVKSPRINLTFRQF